MKKSLWFLAFGSVLAPVAAHAQVPDLVNAFDAGGRALGMGSANNVTGADTLSAYNNPAGLAYLHRTQVGVTIRNLPKAQSGITGDINGAHTFDTISKVGPQAISHAGIAFPFKGRNGANNGTLGFAFTLGGIVQDERFANGSTEGATAAPNYHQVLNNRNDFFSLAYGFSNPVGTLNFGLALLYALNHQRNLIEGTTSSNTNISREAHGWGGLIGLQAAAGPNAVLGLSYRTPISLKDSGSTPLLYDKVPGRLAGGLAIRKDMRGDDFLLIGGEVAHYFEGHRGKYFDSPEQTTLGVGLEYNLSLGFGRLPIRGGYNYIPGGAYDFAPRRTWTFGTGYRPNGSDWGLDLNFAKPDHGGTDMALNLMYRFSR